MHPPARAFFSRQAAAGPAEGRKSPRFAVFCVLRARGDFCSNQVGFATMPHAMHGWIPVASLRLWNFFIICLPRPTSATPQSRRLTARSAEHRVHIMTRISPYILALAFQRGLAAGGGAPVPEGHFLPTFVVPTPARSTFRPQQKGAFCQKRTRGSRCASSTAGEEGGEPSEGVKKESIAGQGGDWTCFQFSAATPASSLSGAPLPRGGQAQLAISLPQASGRKRDLGKAVG